ncbi:hypothetical protein MKJ01_16980 [Chryseobacterium sp. SSA4.19]|uniref:hypothetical protein n=1 Tax=Chryseobacterium sp. SSA4.19 TaxID=2919915 RepID=UPI001F4E749E|nr:hypothetical protein [Chryseobacterium sp. SSA4.19]MCJ8155454.1 hypothetical protein [Chryseobacterium sp. SSA4.19]
MTVHFILSGETLESICEEIHLENSNYLKEFHNSHCAREDIIDEVLMPGRKLLLPDFKIINEYNSRNDAPFKQPKLNPVIPFMPEDFSKIYTVTITEIEENELEKKNNILTYTVSVKWIRKEGLSHIFHIFKNNFSDAQGSMLSDLASESIRALNPLVIKTNDKGGIIKIELNENAASHFSAIKNRLIDLFPDPYARIYLDEFEFAVMNRDLFDKRMKENLFMKIYFASLRNHFQNGKSFLRQTVGEQNIPVELIQKVEHWNSQDEILFRQNETLEQQVIFNGKYTVLAKTGMVKRAEVSYSIVYEDFKSSTFITIE